MNTITRALASTAAAVLTVGVLAGAATAGDDTPAPAEPCAKQAAQVAKAEDALARVTAVFERQAEAVAEAADEVEDASSPHERAEAKSELKQAKAKKAKTAKAKKAQQMRLAKAQERLDTCEAGQPQA